MDRNERKTIKNREKVIQKEIKSKQKIFNK